PAISGPSATADGSVFILPTAGHSDTYPPSRTVLSQSPPRRSLRSSRCFPGGELAPRIQPPQLPTKSPPAILLRARAVSASRRQPRSRYRDLRLPAMDRKSSEQWPLPCASDLQGRETANRAAERCI